MTLHRLVLWRHGETDYNATSRMQGHLDSALTEVGWNQARFAVPVLARYAPELVLTSDLHRAQDTASVFAQVTGVAMRIDKRLRETHLGSWQGLTSAEVDQRWPDARRTWQNDSRFAPPGGETRVDVADRAAELIAELDAELDGTVLLCSHGGLITAVVGRLIGFPEQTWPLLGGIGNCHWAVLGRRAANELNWRLLSYNAGITG